MSPGETTPGSAVHPALPTQQPAPQPVVVHGGVAGVAEVGSTFLQRIATFSPSQIQAISLVSLTIFVCGLAMYVVVSDGRTKADYMGMMLRFNEEQAERGRAAYAIEMEKNRSATSAEAERFRATIAAEFKQNRETILDATKATVASHQTLTSQLGKLEQTVAGLQSALAELKKKLPPSD